MRQAPPGKEGLFGELVRPRRGGEGEKHRSLWRLRRLKVHGETEEQVGLIGYLEVRGSLLFELVHITLPGSRFDFQ